MLSAESAKLEWFRLGPGDDGREAGGELCGLPTPGVPPAGVPPPGVRQLHGVGAKPDESEK